MLPTHTVSDTLRQLTDAPIADHPPRFLILYGSLRQQSYSRFLAEYAAEILTAWGAEVRIFCPNDLPVFDREGYDHTEVQRLRQWAAWSEGMVWCCPEQHGSMTGVFKNQIDWIPLKDGAVRPTQGRTLALMQVCGGSQSFNVVNQLRVLGRWMRMWTIPNQSSIAKAWQEFSSDGVMRDSPYKERVIDVLEELLRFTLLLRSHRPLLDTRFSEQEDLRKRGALTPALGVEAKK
ncbi:MAG: arsenic resistance protein ArsH [Myxococcota bacterium]|jgi:arsenic resistance protein ArsH